MTTETRTRPTNPYASAYASFLEQTEDHHLIVLQDNGLYRHLRVQEPGTRMWSWDITTWPGHLATSGDIADGHIFTREPDMLGFFSDAGRSRDGYYSDGAPSIDVRYWAEKLCGGRSQEVKKYDSDSFVQQVREHLEEDETLGTQADVFRQRQIALLERIRNLKHRAVGENLAPTVAELLEKHWADKLSVNQLFSMDGLSQSEMDQLGDEFDHAESGERATFDLFDLESPVDQEAPSERRDEIVDDARWHAGSENEAHTWLQNNEDFVGSDTFEWDLREYDIHFLFTCYAIALTTKLWDEHVAANGTADTYVLVEDSQVVNKPALPVFDLYMLATSAPSTGTAAQALHLRERILAHPQACKDLTDVVERATAHVQIYGSPDSIQVLDAALTEEQEARDLRARREAERAARIAKQRSEQEERNREHAARREAVRPA